MNVFCKGDSVKMKALRFIDMLYVIFLVCGCDRPQPSLCSGTIVDKQYVAARSWTEDIPVMVGETGYGVVTNYYHQPEHWTIKIKGTVSKDQTTVMTERVLRIPLEEYGALRVGDLYEAETSHGCS